MRSLLKPLLKKASRWRAGPRRTGAGERYDQLTAQIMERCLAPDSNCVDVGCHRGAILRTMVRLSPAGSHFAFEPIPDLYKRLRADFPEVRVYDLALSDHAGEEDFQYVVSRPAYSGLRRRRYPGPQTIQTIRVRTACLDDVIPAECPIAFIKVDVEGAELEVLRGAMRTLDSWRPVVVFEHGSGGAPFYGTRPEDLYGVLSACSLHVSLLHAWLAGGPPLTTDAFSAVVANDSEYYFVAHPRDRQ